MSVPTTSYGGPIMLIAIGKRALVVILGLLGGAMLHAPQPLAAQEKPLDRPLRIDPAAIASDQSIKYDYDIVYVRAPRTAKDNKSGKERLAMVWPDASEPFHMHASTDLMLL